jgi:shikimate 5-dehydrogenase
MISVGSATFTYPGAPGKTWGVGDVIDQTEAAAIVAASGDLLHLDPDGHIRGKNPDGSGDVDIVVGQPLDEGQIHDLHHTIQGAGGNGASGNGHSH